MVSVDIAEVKLNKCSQTAHSSRGFELSRRHIEQAKNFLAGGVSSNFRLGMSPTPLAFENASGPYLFDIDGNCLIDYYLGMGPMILGHTPKLLIERVSEQLSQGILYAGQSNLELRAAQLLCELVPSAERVRFNSSGSEAVQAALRIARAATGRCTILKFEGHYHGWFDNVLWSTAPAADLAGSRNNPNRVPGSAGQDSASGANVDVLPWNDIDLLRERLGRGDVACVITEPAMCNAGCVAPAPGYLEGMREACTASGTLLVFDETITGFRLALGGGQEHFGVQPDLATFAKALGNGFPVAAVVGRADLMDMCVSAGVVHGGTYNSQSASMAATVATLEAVSSPGFYEGLEDHSERLMEAIRRILHDASIPAVVTGFPSVFHVAFGLEEPARDFRDLTRVDRKRYVAFTTALLRRGARVLERGIWFLSSEHDEDTLEATVHAAGEAAKDLAGY